MSEGWGFEAVYSEVNQVALSKQMTYSTQFSFHCCKYFIEFVTAKFNKCNNRVTRVHRNMKQSSEQGQWCVSLSKAVMRFKQLYCHIDVICLAMVYVMSCSFPYC